MRWARRANEEEGDRGREGLRKGLMIHTTTYLHTDIIWVGMDFASRLAFLGKMDSYLDLAWSTAIGVCTSNINTPTHGWNQRWILLWLRGGWIVYSYYYFYYHHQTHIERDGMDWNEMRRLETSSTFSICNSVTHVSTIPSSTFQVAMLRPNPPIWTCRIYTSIERELKSWKMESEEAKVKICAMRKEDDACWLWVTTRIWIVYRW